ncbi:hypothetical protein [Piscibacillus salipiscarius]|uniref:Uncharacterized protein n=1 Tax=Piscibacillus salipiscarius TaxID=299480 RepID=A0ABW5QAW7_9BACI
MEILLFSLLGGLFICVMFSLRMLIEHETDQILNTVMDDYEPKTEPISIPATVPQKSPSLILQHSNKNYKD